MQVAKRDGRVMEFNKQRIVDAIIKAMRQTREGIDEELAKKIAVSIEKQLENRDEVSVYEIQDLVEKKLMVSSRKEVATAYITYRYTRDVARKSKTKNIFLDIITSKSNPLESKEGIYQSIDEMMDEFAAESIKPYVDTMLLSKEVRDAERAGYINIRNKSYYPTKAIKTFQLPILQKSKILKDCKSVECVVIKILSTVGKLKGEICENIILPPVDEIFSSFEEKTYEEELQMIKQVLQVTELEEKHYALARKHSDTRVHNSLKFLMEGLSALQKKVTFLDDIKDYSAGRGVVNAITINLPRIAFEAYNYTKDANIGIGPDLKTNEDENIEEILVSNLQKCVHVALKGMIERFHFQSTATKGQFPTLMSGLWIGSENINEEDTLENVLKNGTLELEIFNIDKAIEVLYGKDASINEKSQYFRKKIIKVITETLQEYSKEYGLNFSWKETNDNENLEEKRHENS